MWPANANTMRILRIGLGLALLALAGCSMDVQAHRANHQRSAYAALSPADQARVQAATIAPGDSEGAVYIALGSPEVRYPHPAGGVAWLYVGRVDRGDADTLTFRSRSENAWVGTPQELVVRLVDGQVVDWQVAPITPFGQGIVGEAARQEATGAVLDWRGPWRDQRR